MAHPAPDFFRSQALPDEAGLLLARVSSEHKGYWGLLCEDGTELLAEARGKLLLRAEQAGQGARSSLPVVGDWVLCAPRLGEGRAQVHRVLSRRTILARREAAKAGREQPFAANVDAALVVDSLDKPLNTSRLQRFASVASRGGAEPWVLLNKVDLAADPSALEAEARAALPGLKLILLSAATGEGFGALEEALAPGRTLVLLGPSGAGKSSLANRLLGREAQATAEVREGDAKGRHTTVARQLLALPGGAWLIDSPGVRELGLVASQGEGDQSFDDVEALAVACRFRDCRHEGEPGCAVRDAVEKGGLDPERYAAYLKLQSEARAAQERKQVSAWEDKRKQAGKILSKTIKNYFKHRGH